MCVRLRVFQACWHQCRPPMGMGTEEWWLTLPESSSQGPTTTTTTHIVSQFYTNNIVGIFGWLRHSDGVCILPMAFSHIFHCIVLFAVPGVSGSSVATGNGSRSILLNFDSEEQSGPSGVRQQQQQMQPLPQQQQGISSPWQMFPGSILLSVCVYKILYQLYPLFKKANPEQHSSHSLMQALLYDFRDTFHCYK